MLHKILFWFKDIFVGISQTKHSESLLIWCSICLTTEAQQKNENENDGDDDKKKKSERSEYDYLLGMPMWNLTLEKVEELKKQLKDKTTELENLKVEKDISNAFFIKFWSIIFVQIFT